MISRWHFSINLIRNISATVNANYFYVFVKIKLATPFITFSNGHLLNFVVRVRPGGLASFGLWVSSDCNDARSIGTWGSPLLLPNSVFL